MTRHGAGGWLPTLADLSIILFMVTAADLSNAEAMKRAPESSSAMVATAEPVAIFRPGPNGASLGAWLQSQPADSRQQLTIHVRYTLQDMDAGMASGLQLAREAELAGRPARLIAEQGSAPELMAFLAYDSHPQAMARNLREPEHSNPEENR